MTDIEYLIHGIALDSGCWMEDTGNMVTDDIDLFSFSKSLAKLAAQVEREACAKVCDELVNKENSGDYRNAANWCSIRIRARGEA
jgi:hypothetical protein